MEGFVYLTGAVYLATTFTRLLFRVVDVIEGRR